MVSIKFPPVIPGPEMAAPILWAPGIFWFFLLENSHAHKIPPFRGGGGGGFWVFLEGGGGWKCQFYFYGRGDFSDLINKKRLGIAHLTNRMPQSSHKAEGAEKQVMINKDLAETPFRQARRFMAAAIGTRHSSCGQDSSRAAGEHSPSSSCKLASPPMRPSMEALFGILGSHLVAISVFLLVACQWLISGLLLVAY